MNNRRIIFTIALSVALLSFVVFMVALVNSWMGPATGVGGDFCEASHAGLIKQPANTWSNLGFIFVGLSVAWQLSAGKFNHNKNTITQSAFYGTFFACVIILLGPGSMAMHATEASVGGWFDMLSMYLIASFTFAYAVERFYSLSKTWFFALYVAALFTCLYVQELPYHVPVVGFIGNFIFAVLISLTVIFEMLNNFVRKFEQEKKYGFLSLGSLILAFIIWNLWKNDSYMCDPQSLIQGHAIWHILDAVAAYFLFRYYASEHNSNLSL